jgi:hypothetical protein
MVKNSRNIIALDERGPLAVDPVRVVDAVVKPG